MPIIFGWGHTRTNEIGVVFKERCPHCSNDTNFLLIVVKVFFTLFFIPVFPYSVKRLITCSICNFNYELDTEDFERLKYLADIYKKYSSGLLTEDEYSSLVKEFNKKNINNEN